MPTERLLYEIEARADGFASGMKKAQQSTKMTDETIRDLSDMSEKLEADLLNLEKAFQAGLIDAEENAIRETRTLEKALQSMINRGIDPSHAGFQRYNKRLQEMKVGLQSTGRSSNTAGLALMDMTRIAEDSAFGIRGIANNINPAVQSFGRLKREAGSTGAALKQMLGSLKGVNGAMLAFGIASSAMIAFGPEIKKFFQSATSEAEEFANTIREAMDSMLQMEDALKFGAPPKFVAAAIQQVRVEIQETERLMEMERERLVLTAGGVDAGNAQLNLLKERKKEQEAELELFQERLDQYNTAIAAENRLKELGFEQVDSKKSINEAKTKSIDLSGKELEEERAISFSLEEQAKKRQALFLQRLSERRKLNQELFNAPEFRKQASFGAAVEGLPDDPLQIPEKIEMAGVRTEEAWADFGSVIAGGMANATANLVTGAADFNQAFGGFLQSLGQGLIGAGVAGIAIKAFVKNPVAAIAAGTALVAIGARLAQSSQDKADKFTSRVGGIGGAGITSGLTGRPAQSITSFGQNNIGAQIGSAVRSQLEGARVDITDGRRVQLVLSSQRRADGKYGRLA